MTVETALGARPVSSLGPTLMHEHIFVLDRELEANYLEPFDEKRRIAEAAQRITDAGARGVQTIVDLTVVGLGRYVPLIKAVAERVAVSIVVATGLYTWDDVPMYFRLRGPGRMIDGPDPMVGCFVKDLTEGIADTGVRAAILKCATDSPGMTAGVERVLRCVAAAHRETGAPITTHTHAGTRRGLEQQEVFRQEGVDLSRVVIGHCGDSTDLDYLRTLMDAGSFIGMDRFGNDLILPAEQRIDTVVALCEQGYAERMVLSHDSSCYSHSFGPEDRERLLPRWTYTYLHDAVLPALCDRGVTADQIRQMLVENPATVLAPRA